MKRSEFKFLLNKLSELTLNNIAIDRKESSRDNSIYAIKGAFPWGTLRIRFQEVSDLKAGRFVVEMNQRGKREIVDYYVCTSTIYSISQKAFIKVANNLEKQYADVKKKQEEAKMNELTAAMMEVFPEILEKQIFGDDK